MGYHFLLQEIFPTQGLNLGLPHYRQTLFIQMTHQKPCLSFLIYFSLSLLHLNNNTFSLNQKVSSPMDPSISVPINLVQAITVSYLNYCFSFLSDLTAHCLAYCNTAAAAAAAKSLQSCPTLCDPIDSSPPDSPSLGFSRQEHWSGLPFPSPMHASGK